MGINKKNTDVIVVADIVNAGRISPLGIGEGRSLIYNESVGTWGLSNGYGIQYTNPNSFVTVGDGVSSTGDYITADLSTVIPSIINKFGSLSPVGGTIFIGKGDYSLSSDVVVNVDNTIICGAGEGQTVIFTASNDFQVYSLEPSDSVDNVKILNMSFEGSGKVLLGRYVETPLPLWDRYYNVDTGTVGSLIEDYLGSSDTYPLDSNEGGASTVTVGRSGLGDLVTSGSYSGDSLKVEDAPATLGSPLVFSSSSGDSYAVASNQIAPPAEFSVSFKLNVLDYSFEFPSTSTGSRTNIFRIYDTSSIFVDLVRFDESDPLAIVLRTAVPTTDSVSVTLATSTVHTIGISFTKLSGTTYTCTLFVDGVLIGSILSNISSVKPHFPPLAIIPELSRVYHLSLFSYFPTALTSEGMLYVHAGPESKDLTAETSYGVSRFTTSPGVPFEEGVGTQDFSGVSPVNNTEISYSVTPRVLLDVAVSSVSVGAAGGTDIEISEGPPRF